MNFVASHLSKPPYPTFSQLISALSNYELHMSSYDEKKPIDHNLAFLGVIDGGRNRGRGRGHCGTSWSNNNNFNSQGRGFLPFSQRRRINNNKTGNSGPELSHFEKKALINFFQVQNEGTSINHSSSTFPVCVFCQNLL